MDYEEFKMLANVCQVHPYLKDLPLKSYSKASKYSVEDTAEHIHFHQHKVQTAIDNVVLYGMMKHVFNIEEPCIIVQPMSTENQSAVKILEDTSVRVTT